MRVLQVRLGPNDPTLQSSKPQGFNYAGLWHRLLVTYTKD